MDKAVTYNGTSWSAPTTIHANDTIYTVSCTSTTRCVAGGTAAVYTFNGTTWSSLAAPGQVEQLSCVGTSFCAAVLSTNSQASYQVRTLSNGTWSGATAISNYDDGISCASTTLCFTTDITSSPLKFNGSTWAKQSLPPTAFADDGYRTVACAPGTSFCGLLNGGGGAGTAFNGTSWGNFFADATFASRASCATASFCVAANDYGAMAADTLAMTFNAAGGSYAVEVDQNSNPAGVSCPTNTFCMIVEDNGDFVKGD